MPSDQQKHSPEGGSVSLNRSAEQNYVPDSATGFMRMKSQVREKLVGAGLDEETLNELETGIENVAEVFRGEVYWGKVLLLMISNDFKAFNEMLVNSGKFTKEMATDLIKISYSVIADYSKLVLRGVSSSEAFKTALFKNGVELANFQASGLVTISVLFVITGFLAACSGAQDHTNPNETPPPPGLSDEEFQTAVAPSTQIAATDQAATEAPRETPTPVAPSKEMLENIFGQPVIDYKIIETAQTLQIFGIREAFEAYQNRVESSNEFQGEINFSAFSILVRFEGQSSETGPYGYTFFNSREADGDTNDFRLDMVVRDSEGEFTTVELHPVIIARDGIRSLAFAQTVNAVSPEYNPETGNGPVLDFPIVIFDIGLTPEQIDEMSDEELARLMVKFYPHGVYLTQNSVIAYDDQEVGSKVLARFINFTPETPQQMGEEFLAEVEIFENYNYLVRKDEEGLIHTVIVNNMPLPLNALIIHQGRVVTASGLWEVGLPRNVFEAMQEANRKITETNVDNNDFWTDLDTEEGLPLPFGKNEFGDRYEVLARAIPINEQGEFLLMGDNLSVQVFNQDGVPTTELGGSIANIDFGPGFIVNIDGEPYFVPQFFRFFSPVDNEAGQIIKFLWHGFTSGGLDVTPEMFKDTIAPGNSSKIIDDINSGKTFWLQFPDSVSTEYDSGFDNIAYYIIKALEEASPGYLDAIVEVVSSGNGSEMSYHIELTDSEGNVIKKIKVLVPAAMFEANN